MAAAELRKARACPPHLPHLLGATPGNEAAPDPFQLEEAAVLWISAIVREWG